MFPLSLLAEEKADDLISYVICKNRGIVRTIRVEWEPTEKVCLTLYTKDGKDKEVGKAQNKSSCNMFLDNIRTNLKNAGWDCKDVSQKADLHSAASLQ